MSGTRRGRRPGAPDTREEILAAARELFSTQGFSGTSMRAIAAKAAVDPALVHHYFGGKDDLLMAALALPVDPRQVLAPVVAQGPDGAGERLLRAFLSVWDDPATRLPLTGILRNLLDPSGERLLRDGFLKVVVAPIGVGLGLKDPERRMALAASQMIGLIMMRYVLAVEPLASMPSEVVVATYGPTLQRYFTGALPAPPS